MAGSVCCCSNRVGTIVTGSLTLVYSLILIGLYSYVEALATGLGSYYNVYTSAASVVVGIQLAMYCLLAIGNIFLIVGGAKKVAGLVVAGYVFNIIYLCLLGIGMIYYIAAGVLTVYLSTNPAMAAVLIVEMVIGGLMIWGCVCSVKFRSELVVPVFHQMATPGLVLQSAPSQVIITHNTGVNQWQPPMQGPPVYADKPMPNGQPIDPYRYGYDQPRV